MLSNTVSGHREPPENIVSNSQTRIGMDMFWGYNGKQDNLEPETCRGSLRNRTVTTKAWEGRKGRKT